MDRGMIKRLIMEARTAQQKAYAPYSHFSVGAAAWGADGIIYTGCNVENASYGLSLCAERNAMFHGVSCGCHEFPVLAIAGDSEDYTFPCGACLQVMTEFHVESIILTKPDNTFKMVTLHDLLPYSFDSQSLK